MLTLALLACLPATALRADPASPAETPWVTTEGTEVRLIAGGATDGGATAALEMRLAPGWKTYWRYPGDSGVPPRFDWSGSRNVEAVRVLWPAPRRFPDGAGGASIGYKGTLLLPLEVRLKQPGTAARLELALDFAICEHLCIPAQAHLALDLPAHAATEDPRVGAARAEVPALQPLGSDALPAITDVTLDRSQTPPRIVVTARAASPAADLFVEGPDETWALPLPSRTATGNDAVRFSLPVLGLPPGIGPDGARLRLTLVDGARAIETEAQLPAR